MEHKGNKWLGKASQFKKRRKKHRKDKEMIFDNSVIAEEESDYVIQDEEGNIIHPEIYGWLGKDTAESGLPYEKGSRESKGEDNSGAI